MTVEQFDALPESQDAIEELHWGLIVTLHRPKAWHVKLQMKLTQMLQTAAAERGYIVMELPLRAIPEYDLRAARLGVGFQEALGGSERRAMPRQRLLRVLGDRSRSQNNHSD